MPLSKEEMDKLHDTPSTSSIVGIPNYYSDDGRVWPIKMNGLILADERE